jgi:hypothetical protein
MEERKYVAMVNTKNGIIVSVDEWKFTKGNYRKLTQEEFEEEQKKFEDMKREGLRQSKKEDAEKGAETPPLKTEKVKEVAFFHSPDKPAEPEATTKTPVEEPTITGGMTKDQLITQAEQLGIKIDKKDTVVSISKKIMDKIKGEENEQHDG